MIEEEIANVLAAKALEDPKVQKIVADAHMFDALRRDPGWQRLYEKTKHEKKRLQQIITNRIWAGGEAPTAAEIAYYKGFIQGAIWVLAHPEVAEQRLESAARQAWLLINMQPTEES